ncbi:MAG TPA: hypothetical protein VGK74_14550 [Symbiobacteriaceae bacterium]
MKQDEVLKQLNRSGFPFQLRVEEEVRGSMPRHHWSVASREHPWTNPETGAAGFADLVLGHEVNVTFRLVIECKRMKADDERQLRWLFLLPGEAGQSTNIASCLEVEGAARDVEWRDIRIWDDVLVTPASLESEFCILPNDEQRKQSILESLAAELLESVEGLAQEEVRVAQSSGGNGHVRRLVFPVIVTNAEIMACSFLPQDISIRHGTLDLDHASVTSVPFIRFRKSLESNFPEGRFHDLKGAQRARQRTVFVVNAEAMSEFLTGWDFKARDKFDGFAIEKRRLWG